jgi:CO/xanthine dehydrogenase Mo-binding subunit
MSDSVKVTRRQFLASTVASAGVITVAHRLPTTSPATTEAAPPPQSHGGDAPVERAMPHRIDGLPKVKGEKIYARDLRARDMPGWPGDTRHALVLRADYSDRPFLGVDVSPLADTPPKRVVLAEDLTRDRITASDLFLKHLLLPKGRIAEHAGQPVAILIFDSFRPFWTASRRVHAEGVVRYGPPGESAARHDIFGTVHYVRSAGTPSDVFSRVKDGWHDPDAVGPEVKEPERTINLRARGVRDDIRQAIDGRRWRVFEGTFSTQIVDPMFMEPEAGLAWWNPRTRRLHLVTGSQSPDGDRALVLAMLGDRRCPFRPASLQYTSCYPGGGFGGRDTSPLPLYLALASAYADGPVRLAYSRFEQFQAGIKRHPSTITNRLAVDAQGTIQALDSSIDLGGGGEANLTGPVVQLCALSAAGPYRIPRTVIGAIGRYTDGAPGGSMRGFGVPQASFAIESLMDDVAAALGEDPIRFRLRHVLRRGERDVTGMALENHVANVEICELALAQPLWTQRDADKRRRDRPESAYGVGFACCMEAYGTMFDGSVAEVAIDPKGEIVLRSHAVDMGQGTATALAVTPLARLGAPAGRVEMGQTTYFDALGLVTKGSAEDPRWTPATFGSSSASMSAFFHVQTVEEACRVLFDHGVLPAAQALWERSPSGEPRWEGGRLVAPGLRSLALAEIAARMHRDGRVVAAMVHTFFRSRFAEADFTVDRRTERRAIDALALRRGGRSRYELIDRRNVAFPPAETTRYDRSLYASGGHVIAVEVARASGEVKILEAVSLLDPGEVIHPQLLHGQIEGGFAQGVGYALFEELPLGAAGATPDWNLHRYRVPRPGDIPLGKLAVSLVPPPPDGIVANGPRVRKKGIAEITLSTVAPAVGNAVAHAIGRRITALPITPARVLVALGRT